MWCPFDKKEVTPLKTPAAYFCPECNKRIAMVDPEEHKEAIIRALEQDMKDMGLV